MPGFNKNYISYLRGKSNIVEVFDLAKEEVIWTHEYKDLKQIKGLIPFGSNIKELKHLLIDETGKAIMHSKGDKKHKDLFQVDGSSVQCLAKNPSNFNEIAIGSKDQLLQIWDVETATKTWSAKNLPNDHLDLKIPIWDTDMEWLSKSNTYSLATCSAYCDVREYDTRGPKKPVFAGKVFDNTNDRYQLKSLFLSKII